VVVPPLLLPMAIGELSTAVPLAETSGPWRSCRLTLGLLPAATQRGFCLHLLAVAQLGFAFQGAIDLIDPRQALLDRRLVGLTRQPRVNSIFIGAG
jgi:hypothetical protein